MTSKRITGLEGVPHIRRAAPPTPAPTFEPESPTPEVIAEVPKKKAAPRKRAKKATTKKSGE